MRVGSRGRCEKHNSLTAEGSWLQEKLERTRREGGLAAKGRVTAKVTEIARTGAGKKEHLTCRGGIDYKKPATS
jgi:hypothetical protein